MSLDRKQITPSSHFWDADSIRVTGNARCEKCGMQFTYYTWGLGALESWTKKEIEQEDDNYRKLIKSYQVCVPR